MKSKLSEYGHYRLNVDKEFKELIRPLSTKEYLQLEENILADGCREALVVWNNTIIDGHNRYEICTKHLISFQIREMEFDSRDAAVSWICANQLGRRNISDETRKFLIGKQYETEKIIAGFKNPKGQNQYNSITTAPKISAPVNNHKTAMRIGEENNISNCTVQRYGVYANAIETIRQKVPELVPIILSGKIKFTHSDIVELSEMSKSDILRFYTKLCKNPNEFNKYKINKCHITMGKADAELDSERTGPSVKDMPKFDPDAEVNSLVLTIPSWKSSIERTKANAKFDIISEKARCSLCDALNVLIESAYEMLDVLEEK